MQYLSLKHRYNHLARHFHASHTPGSRLFEMSKAEQHSFLKSVDALVLDFFLKNQNSQQLRQIGILSKIFDKPIGTAPLAKIHEHLDARMVTITRDKGSKHETPVTLIESNTIPKTNTLIIPVGLMGQNKWGAYTFYSGEYPAPAFPNQQRQTAEQFEKSRNFWKDHGFLATPDEINLYLG